MTPISISFAAFGPYVEEQVVDFTRFLSGELVLIHGETGAGKTVLLDAMTYALYGRSSGGQRGDFSGMRCLSAPGDQPTRVSYTFDVQGRRYRFTRGLRIRKKHSGAFEYLPEQDAFYLDETGCQVPFFENSKARDLEQKAQELIGLDCAQFCQVMILPQGQFERLLVSKSEEKEAVLVNLFHAGRWQEIAERLCTQANGMKQELDTQRAAVRVMLEGFGCEDLDALSQRVEETALALGEQEQARTIAGEQLELKRRLLDAAVQLAELFEKQRQATETVAGLGAQMPEFDRREVRLRLARTAAGLAPHFARWEGLSTECGERSRTVKQAEQTLENAVKTLGDAGETLAALSAGEPDYQRDKLSLGRLQGLLESYRQLDTAEKQRDTAAAAWAQAAAHAAENQSLIREKTGEKERLTKARDYIFQTATMQLPALRERLAELKRTHLLLEKQEDTQRLAAQVKLACDRLETQHAALLEQLEQARRQQSILHGRYLDGAASALSEALLPDCPCPVCGSREHPAAHAVGKDTVSREQLTAAGQAVEDAAGALTQWESARARGQAQADARQEELDTLAKQLAECAAYDPDALAELEHTLTLAETQDGKLPGIQAELGQLSTALDTLQAVSNHLMEQLTQAAAEKERRGARLEALAAQKESGIADLEALERQIAALEKRIRTYEAQLETGRKTANDAALSVNTGETALLHAKEEWQRARTALDAAALALEQGLVAGGFPDAAALGDALLSPEKIELLERQLSDYRTEKELAARRLAEMNTLLEGKIPPALGEAQAEILRLEAEKSALDAAWGALSQSHRQMADTLAAVMEKQTAWEESRLVYDRLSYFGKLLRGDSGVSLRRYVLGVMLSSITAQANQLLRNVHGGRYQLYRTMEGVGRTRKAGLDLEVLDTGAGRRRGVASLSGGEKFLVSLALALGLSAVVQAQSGGVRMDAMFIDEGFGSLDPQSINDALDVLASVKGSRRLVGIISHVAALRESIESAIEVIKHPTGSRIVLHGGGTPEYIDQE